MTFVRLNNVTGNRLFYFFVQTNTCGRTHLKNILCLMQKAAMNKIRFLHVPKTAGTSLTDCLNQFYKNRHYLFSGDLEKDKGRYQKISASKRAQISLFSGHAPRITGIPEVDILPTIAFFRDPVERVKSFCQHVSEG